MHKIDFKPSERQVIEEVFQKYMTTLDIVSKLMMADGRISPQQNLIVADDRSGFLMPEEDSSNSKLAPPATAVNGSVRLS